jgi:hypothetical protein
MKVLYNPVQRERVDSSVGLSRRVIKALVFVACMLILVAVLSNGLAISSSLNPTSPLAFTVHKFPVATLLSTIFSGIFGGGIISILAHSFRSTKLLILSSLVVFVFTSTPLWSPFFEEILKTHHGNSVCEGFEWTVTLFPALPNSDDGSILEFSSSLGAREVKVYRAKQGDYEVVGNNGSIILVLNYRNMTYNFLDSSVSGAIEKNPIQFSEMGLISGGEWFEPCYGLAVELKNHQDDIVVSTARTGISSPGKPSKTVICMNALPLHGNTVVAAAISVELDKVWSECHRLKFHAMKLGEGSI